MSKKLNNKGYTLIELLAVIFVMVSVGMVIISIMVSALRGGNKSQTTNQVRESGNYVLSQMAKTITFAKHLDGLSDGTTDSTTGDLVYQTNCVVPSGTTPLQYSYIKITSFDGGQTTFSCPDSSAGTTSIASNSAPLLGDNYTVTNCTFTCSQPSISIPPTIDISFTLSQKSGSFTEKQATIPFDTSITIRNFGD